jgi:prolyl 4-hydroxylase
MEQHNINSQDNFIMGWYIDPTVCDKLIDLHKNSPDVVQGMYGVDKGVDKSLKDSMDLMIQAGQVPYYYLKHLFKCLNEYYKKYPYAKIDGVDISEQTQIQYYAPGGGFKVWHMEKQGLDWPIVSRHLVFMTFLNTVEDGGGTEFMYQGLTIKAEKGLTLIWPPEWTFTHRGEVSPTEEKYIITGWFNYKTYLRN